MLIYRGSFFVSASWRISMVTTSVRQRAAGCSSMGEELTEIPYLFISANVEPGHYLIVTGVINLPHSSFGWQGFELTNITHIIFFSLVSTCGLLYETVIWHYFETENTLNFHVVWSINHQKYEQNDTFLTVATFTTTEFSLAPPTFLLRTFTFWGAGLPLTCSKVLKIN